MQYLVLLPSLALVDHGKLFVQSHAHMFVKDGARAERYPKRYPNDTKIFPKAPPADQLVTKQDVGSVS